MKGKKLKLVEKLQSFQSEEGRIKFLLTAIQEEGTISHNALLRKALENHVMAKKTAEKLIKKMLEENLIKYIPSGNKKFYSIPTKTKDSKTEDLMQGFDAYIDYLYKKIKKIHVNYKKFSLRDKCLTGHIVSKLLFNLDTFLTTMLITHPKNEDLLRHKKLVLQLLSNVYGMVAWNQDASEVLDLMNPRVEKKYQECDQLLSFVLDHLKKSYKLQG